MQKDILPYIPQRPPFVLVDTLISAKEEEMYTTFTIPSVHPLVEDNKLSESGLVENMAQTAAAGTGYLIQQNGGETPLGFIGALKNLKVIELPVCGSTIETSIRLLHKLLNVHVAEGIVSQNGRTLASCELKIFIQK